MGGVKSLPFHFYFERIDLPGAELRSSLSRVLNVFGIAFLRMLYAAFTSELIN